MNIDIRKSVLDNIKNNSKEEIYQTIKDAVNKKTDVTLPGLGVLFEVIWNKASEAAKQDLINYLL